MSGVVHIFTNDEYFRLKVRVLCARIGLSLCEIDGESGVFDTLIWDVDTPICEKKIYPVRPHARVLLVSRDEVSGCVRLPLENTLLLSFLKNESEARILLEEKGRVATVYGERIRLTEIECALFSYLIRKGGVCATNEELVEHIWGGEATAGAVNVYIHYLREKLELRGERIIRVRRGKGYYIEEKFLEGARIC